MDNTNIMHFDNSIEDSLKNYGMVCQREKSSQYHFIYKLDEGYEEGFISEYDIIELMNGEAGYSVDEIDIFLDNVDSDLESFVKLPILEQVYKLSNHFGVENILGKSIALLSFEDALNILEKE
jgi:hypothetical protein